MKQSDNESLSSEGVYLYSLRQRYLFVSTVIILLISVFVWLTQHYVSNNRETYLHGIESRSLSQRYIRQLRNHVLHVEKDLEAFMWSPSSEHRHRVHASIDDALKDFAQLRHYYRWADKQQEFSEFGDFDLDLNALHITLDIVMDKREKGGLGDHASNVAQTTQPANRQFNKSLQELRELQPNLTVLVGEAEQTWQQLQTDLAFLGKHDPKQPLNTEQARHQRYIDANIPQLLLQLEVIRNAITTDNTPAQHLLKRLHDASSLWQLGYHNLTSGAHTAEHGDMPYMKHTVEPTFQHIWQYIWKLELELEEFARDEEKSISNVANHITNALWLLTALALLVVTVAFVYFDRTVLHPIRKVADALKPDSDEETHPMPQVHNRETANLVDAYLAMREEVQNRQLELEHLALHDSVTKLPNRHHLMRTLQRYIDNNTEAAPFTILLLGLNGFKEVNDTLGQNTGDDALRKVGQRLKRFLQPGQEVCRFAGDEFALFLPNTHADGAKQMARLLLAEMEHPISLDGINISIAYSIGIALYPRHGSDTEELLRCANVAMTVAKQRQSGFIVYDNQQDSSRIERIALAGELRQAIQHDGLHLCYQPQFSVQQRELIGMEVLCRWEHPERGFIRPDVFISIAEQTGQVHAITRWVLEKSFQQTAKWREQGLEVGLLSVNISAFDLHAPDFYDFLRQLLQRWEVPASQLMLELTETAMMSEPAHALKVLEELRGLGIKLAIDDYGTGFSSLAYLKQLPVNELKIDKSFITEMMVNENDAVIVRSTIDLAHNLGLKVVAEGVENQDSMELLQILNCDYMQGFYLGKPMLAKHIEPMLPGNKQGAHSRKLHNIEDYRQQH